MIYLLSCLLVKLTVSTPFEIYEIRFIWLRFKSYGDIIGIEDLEKVDDYELYAKGELIYTLGIWMTKSRITHRVKEWLY